MARWESRTFYVYIMGSKFGVLYIGVTNNLERRVKDHREGLTPGFTKKYRVRRLLYFEQFDRPTDAISRETDQRMEAGKKAGADSFDESGDERS
jgi:putative endonuclease